MVPGLILPRFAGCHGLLLAASKELGVIRRIVVGTKDLIPFLQLPWSSWPLPSSAEPTSSSALLLRGPP